MILTLPRSIASRVARFPAIVFVFFIFLHGASRAAPPGKVAFDIPAGDALVTLKQFTAQSRSQLLYSADEVEGVRTNATRGEFSAREALERMCASTRLLATQDERSGALSIRPKPAEPAEPSSVPPDHAPAKRDKDVLSLDKFVVAGTLAGRAKAMKMEKESRNLVNIVSADSMGTFPDLNAAEALKRLPGVSLYLSGGEGRFISIRGARQNYNGTLLNGFTLPSGDRAERQVDLQTISNSMIQRIEVTKAATPDLPAEGIGGVANIFFFNPLETLERDGRVSVYYATNSYNGSEIRGDARYADFLDRNRKYAIGVTVNYRKMHKDEIETNTRGNTLLANLVSSDTVTGSGGSAVLLPGQEQLLFVEKERRNRGAELSFGAQLGEKTRILVRGFDSRFEEPTDKSSLYYLNIVPVRNAAGTPVDLTATGGLVNARVQRDWRSSVWCLGLTGGQIQGETALSDSFKIDAGYAYHHGLESYKDDTAFFSAVTNVSEAYRLGITREALFFTPSGTISAAATDPANLRIASFTNFTVFPRKDTEEEHTPYVNLVKDIDMAAVGRVEFKTGFYGRIRHKKTDMVRYTRTQVAGSNLTMRDLGSSRVISDFDGKGIQFGPLPDRNIATPFTQNNPAAFGPLVFDRTPGYDASDFTANEDIYVEYAMATYRRKQVTLIGGARYENTEVSFRRLGSVPAQGVLRFNNHYDHLLPSLHAKYDLTKNILFRTSWTKTVARPDPQTIYTQRVIDNNLRTIVEPNPGLQALISNNLDLSMEWYSGALGQFSAACFSKDIVNFPLVVQDIVTIDGLPYTRTQTISKVDGEIRGWEAAFRRKFDFLPVPFDGLGVELNYAMIDSKVLTPTRPDHPRLEIQPDKIINASVYYAYGGFYIRVAVSQQGKAIDRAGTSTVGPAFDRWADTRTQWDLSTSYDVTRKLQLFGEWRNITNAADRYFFGIPDNLAIRRTFGTQVGFGLRMHY